MTTAGQHGWMEIDKDRNKSVRVYAMYPYKSPEEKTQLFTYNGDKHKNYAGEERIHDGNFLKELQSGTIVSIKLASPMIALKSFDVGYTLPATGDRVHYINVGGTAFDSNKLTGSPIYNVIRSVSNELKDLREKFWQTYKERDESARRRRRGRQNEEGTMYGRYAMPGGENYRELLFYRQLPLLQRRANVAFNEFKKGLEEKYIGNHYRLDLDDVLKGDYLSAEERAEFNRLEAGDDQHVGSLAVDRPSRAASHLGC